MKSRALLQITVTTTAKAEDVVATIMGELLEQPATGYTDEKTRTTRVSVYCPQPAIWTAAKRRELAAALQRIKAAGLDVGHARISTHPLARENWAESWKRHFKPIVIGNALLVRPSWIKRPVRPGQAVVVLDPGLSFGTGHHATTGFCLQQLVRCRKTEQPQSFLDMGTGSGILAIAAVKLGYAPVAAFDFDPESVRVAQKNARRNRVEQRVVPRRQDLTRLPLHSRKQYDVVCANLISTLLLAEAARIVNRLRPGGILVLAGILEKEYATVRLVYEKLGLQQVAARNEKEWRSGAFIRLAGDDIS